jgi:molybdate/tungstate transport system substrate-binding protein
MAGNNGVKYYDIFLDYKLWLTKKGSKEVLGHEQFMILKKIEEGESLHYAAEHLGISYRKAWDRIRNSEKELGFPLIETFRGGKEGGSSKLSVDGKRLLDSYFELRSDVDKLIKERVRNFFHAVNTLSIILLSLILTVSCTGRKGDVKNDIGGDLIIFHAGSLSLPFKTIADSFMKIHPEVVILSEASGSIDAARKITELGRDCDIIASADYAVIDKLLIPEFASENIKFAANEMAIVFNEKSRYSSIINKDNWKEILSRKDVFYGRSDPNADPCGYRTLLTWQLAKVDMEKFLSKDTRFIRPKEVDLLALLDVNALDYIFIYKSVAVQHNLKFIELGDSVNLSNSALNDWYATSSVEVRGSSPGETLKINGEAMVYGIAILNNAPNKKGAEAFLDFLLSEEGGRKILNQMGQTPVYSK